MKEYRVKAIFDGSVYTDRVYKRKIVYTPADALNLWQKALDYYTGTKCYSNYLLDIIIESRECTDWEPVLRRRNHF